jgi:hypothetical protein
VESLRTKPLRELGAEAAAAANKGSYAEQLAVCLYRRDDQPKFGPLAQTMLRKLKAEGLDDQIALAKNWVKQARAADRKAHEAQTATASLATAAAASPSASSSAAMPPKKTVRLTDGAKRTVENFMQRAGLGPFVEGYWETERVE